MNPGPSVNAGPTSGTGTGETDEARAARLRDRDIEELAGMLQSAIDNANGNARLLARAHRLRGQVFAETADLPHAEDAYRAALAADPESNIADLHYGLALALLAQHRDDEAIVELKKEIEGVVARFKSQDEKIQKVSAQVEVNDSVSRVVANK